MGKRSGMAGETLAASELTLEELNRQIAFLEKHYRQNVAASRKRDAFRQLVWLEAERERLHNILAPVRKYPRGR